MRRRRRPSPRSRRCPGQAPATRSERRARTVDEIVDDARDDDLAAERVAMELRGEPFAQELREVALELGREVRILRQVRGEQLSRERDLRVREQDRELRGREPAAGRLAL